MTMQPPRNENIRARRPNAEFQMPLPRFHPAVYQSPSGSSSNSNTASTLTSPRSARTSAGLKPPSSPRQQPRQYNEATRKLMEYQQEILRSAGATGVSTLPTNIPHTPSLGPCRSPGPATPLTLEDQAGDYLTAGALRRGGHGDNVSQRDLIETLIREEQERRQGGVQTGPSSPPISPVPT